MTEEDILIITADHGCDPTTPSTDHSREYVPLLVYGKTLTSNINLGTLKRRLNLGSSTDSLHSTIVKSNCTETLKNINTKFDVKIL